MSVVVLPTSVGRVSNEAGASVRARRIALGMSASALAKRAGVDRGRLAALEAGERVRDTTAAAVESTLSALEHETGMDLPSQVAPIGDEADDLVEFVVEGNFGVRAVVKGPVRDMDAMQQAVSKIIAGMQHSEGGPSN